MPCSLFAFFDIWQFFYQCETFLPLIYCAAFSLLLPNFYFLTGGLHFFFWWRCMAELWNGTEWATVMLLAGLHCFRKVIVQNFLASLKLPGPACRSLACYSFCPQANMAGTVLFTSFPFDTEEPASIFYLLELL